MKNWLKTTRNIFYASTAASLVFYAAFLFSQAYLSTFFHTTMVICNLTMAISAVAYFIITLKKKQFGYKMVLPLLIAFILLLIDRGYSIRNLTEKIKSPIVIAGSCDHLLWIDELKLRKDKSFELYEGKFFGSQISRGTYSIYRDTIMLEFKPYPDSSSTYLCIENYLNELGSSKQHSHAFYISINQLKN